MLPRSQSFLFEILEAFLTPQYVVRMGAIVESYSDPQVALQNLWCLSPSIHKAFRQGHVVIHARAARLAEIGYPIEECSPEMHNNQVRTLPAYTESSAESCF